ncbi:hypothetical protein AC22_2269 [Escherichia coli 5-366-08_S3_C2]|nr:hypothetical protein AC22_2269 [Escherichia coli 5-366-08_S3_C2]
MRLSGVFLWPDYVVWPQQFPATQVILLFIMKGPRLIWIAILLQ